MGQWDQWFLIVVQEAGFLLSLNVICVDMLIYVSVMANPNYGLLCFVSIAGWVSRYVLLYSGALHFISLQMCPYSYSKFLPSQYKITAVEMVLVQFILCVKVL